jgi:hypothetical protein
MTRLFLLLLTLLYSLSGPAMGEFSDSWQSSNAARKTAAEVRAENLAKGIPDSQLGPSGKPKVHVVEKSTRKETVDAAREAGGSKPIKHTQDKGQPTHYHPVDADRNKLTGKKNIHFQQRGAKPNPE